MIKVETMHDPVGVTMTLVAPFTALDLKMVGEKLDSIPEQQWRRLLVEVDSIGIAEPKALWEDLKLAPHIRKMHAVAVLTDIEWYGWLSEISGALMPRLVIKHFEPGDQDSAVAWLAGIED